MFKIDVQSEDGEKENRRPYKSIHVRHNGQEVFHCELSPACRDFAVRPIGSDGFLLKYDYKGEQAAYRFYL